MDRFWSKVKKSDGCWEWTGSKSGDGYGRIWYDGRCRQATHISWLIHHGKEPPGDRFVCHTCDNPGCVRPDHLFLATNQENMIDCANKGRASTPRNTGEDNPNARLDETKVRAMRALLAVHFSAEEVSHCFGVAVSTVWDVQSGRRWPSVPHCAEPPKPLAVPREVVRGAIWSAKDKDTVDGVNLVFGDRCVDESLVEGVTDAVMAALDALRTRILEGRKGGESSHELTSAAVGLCMEARTTALDAELRAWLHEHHDEAERTVLDGCGPQEKIAIAKSLRAYNRHLLSMARGGLER